MKKFSKIGKRVLAFFLVALMNINAYATTTSNDGSAFVTKAEFDDMMKKFNDNMETYNAGLNAKIDDAISNYLAGMSTYATKTLDNYWKTIKESKSNIYWTSSTTYAYSPNKCQPKHDFVYEEMSRMSAFQGEFTTNAKNASMAIGKTQNSSKNVKYFVVDDAADINPVIRSRYKYFYGFYTAATSTAEKTPNMNQAGNKISLADKTGTYFGFFGPGNTSESSVSSWRTIQCVMSYSDGIKYKNSRFVLSPYSETESYGYDSNNKEKITTKYASLAYNSTNPKWTWTDTRINTSVQTRDVSAITKNSETMRIFDVEQSTIPWMHTQYKMNEMGHAIINSVTNENLPIKYGVKISKAEDNGEVDITYKCTQPGYAIFHIGAAVDGWPKPSDATIPAGFIVSDLLSADESITTKLKDVKAGDGIWFIYYPMDTTKTDADVTIDKIILTVR